MDGPSPEDVQERLLAWFDMGHRDMPWRRTKDPYRILIAEYLLQRTRVASVTPYYERFVERFPNVAALAAASDQEVLKAWEGLGYYRRARNLHASARVIMSDHAGRIPSDTATLTTLPGVGPYTAGAVASIAFGERVPAIDGNVTRVLARLFRVDADVTAATGHARIRELAAGLVPSDRPGAFNQALMELGSRVCTPRRPSCPSCPLAGLCLARAAGVEASLPRAPPRRRPKTVPVCFAYVRSRGRILLVRRPESGLLGGLWSLPGGEVQATDRAGDSLRAMVAAQCGVRVVVHEGVAEVVHSFSHRRWSGSVYRCAPRRGTRPLPGARWVAPGDALGLPMVPEHRKLLAELESRRPLESFDSARRRRRA